MFHPSLLPCPPNSNFHPPLLPRSLHRALNRGVSLSLVTCYRLCSPRGLWFLCAAATRLWLPALAAECHRRLADGLDADGSASALGGTGASLSEGLAGCLIAGSLAQSYCNLRLRTTDGVLHASRPLLCCRSEYLRTLLCSRFREGQCGAAIEATADLTPYGIDCAQLVLLLRFLYCGRVTVGDAPGGDLVHLSPSDAMTLRNHALSNLSSGLGRP